MSKPKAYIASPMGFVENTRTWYDNTLLPTVSNMSNHLTRGLSMLHIYLKLILQKGPPRLGGARNATLSNHTRRIDLVIAVSFDQEPPDTGTVAEIALCSGS